jgi:hypothetical protein
MHKSDFNRKLMEIIEINIYYIILKTIFPGRFNIKGFYSRVIVIHELPLR